ncbi:hypothetical protein FGW37_00375 [Streptomyces rectiverticillatus]|nr:DUF6087 family protein [Streptomyces rectiverticillatus]QLE70274.1 hypothetical protein FGW37_00375 [Streptomyces rectiverticillatus]
MGKHRRPGPFDQSSRVFPHVDSDDPLAPFQRRRKPPLDGPWRRHRPAGGGATHVRSGEERLLEEWDGFAYQPAGIAPNLAEAQKWARGER